MELNFEIKDNTAIIDVDTGIFPKNIILRTAYKFIDRAWISIEGKDSNKISIKLLPRDEIGEEEIKDLALSFDMNLITSYVEDLEARRYAEARNSMIKAAMFSQTENKEK